MAEVFHDTLTLQTKGNKVSYFNIREECREFVKKTGIKDGLLVVQSPHTTCSVIFEEMDHDTDPLGDYFLQADLNKGLEWVFPKQRTYDDYYKYAGPKHFEFGATLSGNVTKGGNKQNLLNAEGHLRSTLIGSDCTFVIREGELQIGKYGYIFFVDFDGNRPRERKCLLCAIGE